jgi:glycosyltransferase involved in cell wall biosynthesis
MSVLSRLREAGLAVAAYMHDCHFVTGRCVHMGSCAKFISGCDAECPTADEPPRLPREKIAAAWRERAGLFSGPRGIPLIANSNWTRSIALQRFGGAGRIEMVHLGLDHDLFAPMPKSVLRELLGLPQDKIVVTMGAFDVRDRWKGGPLFQSIHSAMLGRDDVAVTLVGGASEQLAAARSFGQVTDERYMPFVLNAADIFINTAIEETFGQMLLEASACAVPVVSLDVGGVGDVVAQEQSGILVRQKTAPDLLAGVERLIRDRSLRERMGQAARMRVERQFTLAHQADAWIACLHRLFA